MEKRTERLHLERELAAAEAREKAYAEIEEGAMGEKASIHSSPTAVQPQAPQPQLIRVLILSLLNFASYATQIKVRPVDSKKFLTRRIE